MQQLRLWSNPSPPGGDDVVEARSAPVRPLARVQPRDEPGLEQQRALGTFLAERIGRPLHVTFTRNRSTMLTCRESGRQLRVRIHRMFADASPEIWDALVAYLGQDDRRAGRVLDAFIAAVPTHQDRPAPRIRARGTYHDLDDIMSEVNARYFHGAGQARITWGSPGSRRRRRSIQLGCYVSEDRLIRIHPSLDQHFVPRHYVAWIIFHEMLHEVFNTPADRGRRCVHPPEFLALEESHPDYERCKRWEAENLDRLLRYRHRRR